MFARKSVPPPINARAPGVGCFGFKLYQVPHFGGRGALHRKSTGLLTFSDTQGILFARRCHHSSPHIVYHRRRPVLKKGREGGIVEAVSFTALDVFGYIPI